MLKILNSLLDILFPKICNGCGGVLTAHEQIICTTCRHQATLAGFHITKADTLKNIFYGRVAIQEATALLKFQKKASHKHYCTILSIKNKKISALF